MSLSNVFKSNPPTRPTLVIALLPISRIPVIVSPALSTFPDASASIRPSKASSAAIRSADSAATSPPGAPAPPDASASLISFSSACSEVFTPSLVKYITFASTDIELSLDGPFPMTKSSSTTPMNTLSLPLCDTSMDAAAVIAYGLDSELDIMHI